MNSAWPIVPSRVSIDAVYGRHLRDRVNMRPAVSITFIQGILAGFVRERVS